MSVLPDRTKQHDAERELVFGWCRRLGLPLWSPPRAPEAIDALGREVERLREALVRMDEAVCHGSPETAKRIAREAYGAFDENHEPQEGQP